MVSLQWLTKLSQCFAVLDRRTWCGMITQSMVLKLIYNKIHLIGFVEQFRLCDLDKNLWSNEQYHIGTHWDSFVSISYFTCFVTFKAKTNIECACGNYKQCHVILFVLV